MDRVEQQKLEKQKKLAEYRNKLLVLTVKIKKLEDELNGK